MNYLDSNNAIEAIERNFKPDLDAKASELKQLLVTNKEQYELALKEAKSLDKLIKDVDKKRKEFLKPLKDVTDTVNAFCKELVKDAGPAVTTAKSRAAAWAAEERKRVMAEQRRIEQERIRREAELEKAKQEQLKILQEEQDRAEAQGKTFGIEADTSLISADRHELRDQVSEIKRDIEISTKSRLKELETPKNVRKNWVFRVSDESQIPDKYWQLDEKQIRADIKSGARKIPGLIISFEEQVILR